MEQNTTAYFGIADCHGVESILEHNEVNRKELPLLNMRAHCNRQRHALLYMVDLTPQEKERVDRALIMKQWGAALNILKEDQNHFRTLPEYEKSVHLIPNPDLDPWR